MIAFTPNKRTDFAAAILFFVMVAIMNGAPQFMKAENYKMFAGVLLMTTSTFFAYIVWKNWYNQRLSLKRNKTSFFKNIGFLAMILLCIYPIMASVAALFLPVQQIEGKCVTERSQHRYDVYSYKLKVKMNDDRYKSIATTKEVFSTLTAHCSVGPISVQFIPGFESLIFWKSI